MICQFLIGIFIPGTLLQAFIVISELVDHLALAGLLVYLSQPVGLCILTLKAYFIKDWKMLTMVCTAPYVIILLACGFVPESVKWLHLHREEIKMKKTIAYIAKWNKKTIPEHIKISELPKKLTRMTNPLDLFRSMTMASLTLTQGFLWMFVSICYYGVHLAANHLGGSVYRDFIILNAVEIPILCRLCWKETCHSDPVVSWKPYLYWNCIYPKNIFFWITKSHSRCFWLFLYMHCFLRYISLVCWTFSTSCS